MGLLTEDKSVVERLRNGVGRGDWSSEKPTLLATLLGGAVAVIAAIATARADATARAQEPAPRSPNRKGGNPFAVGLFNWRR